MKRFWMPGLALFFMTVLSGRALAQSRNIPALKLADHIGIKTIIDYAHRANPYPLYEELRGNA